MRTPTLTEIAERFVAQRFDSDEEWFRAGLPIFLRTPFDVQAMLLMLDTIRAEWATERRNEIMAQLDPAWVS